MESSRMDTNKDKKIVYPELSYQLMKILFTVHNRLGPDLQEKHYQRAITLELGKQKINFEREKEIDIFYDGNNIGKYYLDFLIEGKIILEIKVAKNLVAKFSKQVIEYLKSAPYKLAIIANFGKQRLEYKRLVY